MLFTDKGTLGGVTRTKDGGISAPVYFCRTGILSYVLDGKVVRVLRDPTEVFDPKATASLQGAAVTVFHPVEGDRRVNASNWPALAKGHVATVDGKVMGDGYDFLAGRIVVQDPDTVARVLSGELCEVSVGLDAEWDATPGTYDGQDYEVVHRELKFNHLALLPKHGGRAGPECRVQLDSADPLEAAQAAHDARYGVVR